ncbi:hypothetical protein FHT00_000259 [Sphingomonas insulae]|uniref:Uncharacterized protein n=1 Tax=Sphingomonas insulae TaxID=424800 RepID=A0ABN1HUH0_9SPHN|nr:hypothetical protein [Sphingomonas insulae]NIJ28331.1 hypothetical protein [Sphingomonas insulae]
MLFTTTTQFAALALCLVAGWFLGLASHSGGRKWKTRYAAEREAHAGYRKQNDTSLADANRRIAELEHENARLTKAAAVVPVAAAPTLTERVTGRPSAARAARPAYPADRRPGWFDFGPNR